MKTDTENARLEVQETLDELLSERLIPFRLTAYELNTDAPGQYQVPFNDSRLHSIRFSWRNDGSSFKEAIRIAVLEGTKGMSTSYERFRASA